MNFRISDAYRYFGRCIAPQKRNAPGGTDAYGTDTHGGSPLDKPVTKTRSVQSLFHDQPTFLASGNGFIPPVRKDIYEQLSATIADATRNAGTEARSPGLPRNWDEVAPGHLVVAKEGPGWGWYEAIVVKVEGDMLTLHWRDFPWQPDIIQHRSNIALISPGQ